MSDSISTRTFANASSRSPSVCLHRPTSEAGIVSLAAVLVDAPCGGSSSVGRHTQSRSTNGRRTGKMTPSIVVSASAMCHRGRTDTAPRRTRRAGRYATSVNVHGTRGGRRRPRCVARCRDTSQDLPPVDLANAVVRRPTLRLIKCPARNHPNASGACAIRPGSHVRSEPTVAVPETFGRASTRSFAIRLAGFRGSFETIGQAIVVKSPELSLVPYWVCNTMRRW